VLLISEEISAEAMQLCQSAALLVVLALRCDAGLVVSSTGCDPACGAHGACRSGICECEAGWAGKGCSLFLADEGAEHSPQQAKVVLEPAVLALIEQAANASAPRGAASQEIRAPTVALETSAPAPAESAGATASGAIRVAREAVLAVSRTAAELLPTSNLRGADASASLLQKPSLTHVATKCEANCSGHGTCEESGRCTCKPGWIGSFCDMPLCPSNCNKRGMCLHGKCLCQPGWHGKACHIQRCPNDCSGSGYCIQGKCKCNEGFDGLDCTTVTSGRQSVVIKLKHSDPSSQEPQLGIAEVKGVEKYSYGDEGPWALPMPRFPL